MGMTFTPTSMLNHCEIRICFHRLEKCIADVCAWIKNNSLKINKDKTEFIIFHKNKELTSRYTLQVGDNSIPLSTINKILGVSLDLKMTLNQHISNTCRSAYYQLPMNIKKQTKSY